MKTNHTINITSIVRIASASTLILAAAAMAFVASSDTRVQPTYTGWTARDCLGPDPCIPHVGPIGTLPGYYENGLVSGGDPGVAFGPVPDAEGRFSWANGSRLYYANLAANFSTLRSEQ